MFVFFFFNSDTVKEDISAEKQQASPAEETHSALPTRLLEERETRETPVSSTLLPPILLENDEPGHTGGCTVQSEIISILSWVSWHVLTESLIMRLVLTIVWIQFRLLWWSVCKRGQWTYDIKKLSLSGENLNFKFDILICMFWLIHCLYMEKLHCKI